MDLLSFVDLRAVLSGPSSCSARSIFILLPDQPVLFLEWIVRKLASKGTMNLKESCFFVSKLVEVDDLKDEILCLVSLLK